MAAKHMSIRKILGTENLAGLGIKALAGTVADALLGRVGLVCRASAARGVRAVMRSLVRQLEWRPHVG